MCVCVLSYAKLHGKAHQKITAEDREVTERYTMDEKRKLIEDMIRDSEMN